MAVNIRETLIYGTYLRIGRISYITDKYTRIFQKYTARSRATCQLMGSELVLNTKIRKVALCGHWTSPVTRYATCG